MTIKKEMCSHTGKKYSVNVMSRLLSPLLCIFRAGWDLKNANTIFDYLVKEAVNDIEAAKACAGWTAEFQGKIFGGFTNRLSDLPPSDRQSFINFCRQLFVVNLENMEWEFVVLCGLSILRFYKDFREALQGEPNGKYDEPSRLRCHPFLSRVEDALHKAQIPRETFDSWQQRIVHSYETRNLYSLNLSQIRNPNAVMVDHRNMIQSHDSLVQSIRELSSLVTHLRSDILLRLTQLSSGMEQLRNSHEQLQLQLCGMKKSADEATTRRIPLVQPFHAFLLKYPKKQVPPFVMFRFWFTENLPRSYERSLELVDKKEMPPLRQCLSKTKKFLQVMLKCLDKYPTQCPPAFTEEYHVWNANIDDLYRKCIHQLGLNGKKPTIPSIAKLVKEYEERDWPEGMPPQDTQYFQCNSRNPNGRKGRSPVAVSP